MKKTYGRIEWASRRQEWRVVLYGFRPTTPTDRDINPQYFPTRLEASGFLQDVARSKVLRVGERLFGRVVGVRA